MKWLEAVWFLAVKDVRNELRTRESLASMFAFAIMVIVLFHFAFADLGSGAAVYAPGALWMTFTFSSMIGLSRSFSMEEANGCLRGLLLLPHDRSVVFAGKVLSGFITISASCLVTTVLFLILFNLPISVGLLTIILVMLLGVLGITAAGTVFSAMTIGTRMRQTLLPVLVLPVILPLIIFGANITAQVMDNAPFGDVAGSLFMIVLFDIIILTAGTLVFEHVVVE